MSITWSVSADMLDQINKKGFFDIEGVISLHPLSKLTTNDIIEFIIQPVGNTYKKYVVEKIEDHPVNIFQKRRFFVKEVGE